MGTYLVASHFAHANILIHLKPSSSSKHPSYLARVCESNSLSSCAPFISRLLHASLALTSAWIVHDVPAVRGSPWFPDLLGELWRGTVGLHADPVLRGVRGHLGYSLSGDVEASTDHLRYGVGMAAEQETTVAFKGRMSCRWRKMEEKRRKKIEHTNTCQSSIIDGHFLRPTSIHCGRFARPFFIDSPACHSPDPLVSGVCLLDATFAFHIHQPVNKNPNICLHHAARTDVTNPVDGSPWIASRPKRR